MEELTIKYKKRNKLIKFKYLIIFAVLISCKEEGTINSIVIKNDRSSVIDLFEGRYTVYHREGKISSNRFKIEDCEVEKIKKAYYENGMGQMRDTLTVTSSDIIMMPFNTTTYTITYSDGRKQEITVEEDSKTNPLHLKKYIKIRNFINQINQVIDSKNEIKNAPKSDILYM